MREKLVQKKPLPQKEVGIGPCPQQIVYYKPKSSIWEPGIGFSDPQQQKEKSLLCY